MNSQEIVFPGEETKAKIVELPRFTHDVSMFAGLTAENIIVRAMGHDGPMVVNASNMSDEERSEFEMAQDALDGDHEIILYDEKAKVSEITREITSDVLDLNVLRGAFRDFVLSILNGEPEAFVDEYNTYFAPRGNSYDEAHYFENIGLEDVDDSLRSNVSEMFDRVLEEEIAENTTFYDKFEKVIVPGLDDCEGVESVRDQARVLLLGMLSNMVRGVFYNETNTDKVYGMRKKAVEHVQQALAMVA